MTSGQFLKDVDAFIAELPTLSKREAGLKLLKLTATYLKVSEPTREVHEGFVRAGEAVSQKLHVTKIARDVRMLLI